MKLMKMIRTGLLSRVLSGLSLFLACAVAVSAATLTVSFRNEIEEPAGYDEVNVYLLNMGTARSIEDAVTRRFEGKQRAVSATFKDLEPGQYVILTFTGTIDQVNDANRPGAFRSQDMVELESADAIETVEVEYETFDPKEWRGSETAGGKVLSADGKPLGGIELRAVTVIDSAGILEIEKVKTDAEGGFSFSKLASGKTYLLLDSNDNPQEQFGAGDSAISIKLPPQAGHIAPGFSYIDLKSGEKRKLSDLKGKVVVLEFWASWCGPCQAPMEKMQAYRASYPEWGDRVELLTLSIDEEKKSAVDHLAKNGWDKTDNAWAGDGGFRAEAPRIYGVTGIPAAFLIDQEGKIATSGHPMMLDMPKLVNELLGGSE